MSKSRIKSLAMAVAAAALTCGPANAQPGSTGSSATATASVTVLRGMSLIKHTNLSFGRVQNMAGAGFFGIVTVTSAPPTRRLGQNLELLPFGGETPATYGISGEPNRTYRVSVPIAVRSIPGMFLVGDFTLWTANRGPVTPTGRSILDQNGNDSVRIGGSMRVPRGTRAAIFMAVVPVTISYE